MVFCGYVLVYRGVVYTKNIPYIIIKKIKLNKNERRIQDSNRL
jgi:hypothetical protein